MQTFEFTEKKRNTYIKINGSEIINLKPSKRVLPELIDSLVKERFQISFEANTIDEAKEMFFQYKQTKGLERIALRQKEAEKMLEIKNNLDNASALDIFKLMCYESSKGEGWSLTKYVIDTKNALTKELHELLGSSYTFSPYSDGSFVIKGSNGKRVSNYRGKKNQVHLKNEY